MEVFWNLLATVVSMGVVISADVVLYLRVGTSGACTSKGEKDEDIGVVLFSVTVTLHSLWLILVTIPMVMEFAEWSQRLEAALLTGTEISPSTARDGLWFWEVACAFCAAITAFFFVSLFAVVDDWALCWSKPLVKWYFVNHAPGILLIVGIVGFLTYITIIEVTKTARHYRLYRCRKYKAA